MGNQTQDSAAAEERKDAIQQDATVTTLEKSDTLHGGWVPPEEWVQRLVSEYTDKHVGETLPPGSDPLRVAKAILTLSEDEAVAVFLEFRESQRNDYTIDQKLLQQIEELAKGPKHCDMEEGEWAYTVCRTAGILHNWSPYAEVRAVTLPYDDPEEACESFRAYVLGFFWVCVVTAVNTCKSQREFVKCAFLC